MQTVRKRILQQVLQLIAQLRISGTWFFRIMLQLLSCFVLNKKKEK